MKLTKYILFLLSVLLLPACAKTKPQQPSNKYKEIDTAQVNLVMLNQRLAQEADIKITKYVKDSTAAGSFTLSEYGFWYSYKERTSQDKVLKNDVLNLHLTYKDFDTYALIMDEELEVKVGQRLPIPAVDDALQLMRYGESMLIYAPWYTAYGSVGNKWFNPYQNLMIEIIIL